MQPIRNHFIYMLVALIIFLVVLPVMDELGIMSETWSTALGFTCLLAIGVWSLRGSGVVFKVGLAIAALGIAMNVLAVSPAEGKYFYGSLSAVFVFLVISVWSAFRQVAISTEISANRLIGAICVYLLLGTLWAIAYIGVEAIWAGSFNNLALADEPGWDYRWTYFSFVTLTTLGYGDITPASDPARVLAFAEAVFGVFYMAVMVAALVSVYIAERRK